jgi:flagellar basal-body rod protein FlgF
VNSGIYTAYSGMQAQLDALEILANNLANINTTGFKEDKAFFTYLNQSLDASQQSGDLNATVNRTVQARGALNVSDGSLNATGRELDIAIEGNGFLAIKTPNGVRYTRNGNLHMDSKFVLSTSDGYPVLGATSGRPITLGPGNIHINEDGDVFLDDTSVERLKVVSIGDLSTLTKEGSSLFASSANSDAIKASDAKVRSGYLEQSNVNSVASIVRMVNLLRHFESIQKSINLEMNDMNAKVIEKLGR